jgi:metal-responsive CopG/Arc/MetJ family transcriptional regulator
MQDTKQLNVKLPSDLYDRILKTGKSRKDVIVDALNMYFDVNVHNHQQEPQQNDKSSDVLMEKQLQEKDKQISELHILLQTTLNQNLITSPENEKRWWKFWA